MPDGYMDAAAVPVPDDGGATLREQLTWELIEHCSIPRYHEDGTENWDLAYCPTCGAEGLYGPNSPDHARHQADALLPRIRDHVAAAVQAERERLASGLDDMQAAYPGEPEVRRGLAIAKILVEKMWEADHG